MPSEERAALLGKMRRDTDLVLVRHQLDGEAAGEAAKVISDVFLQ